VPYLASLKWLMTQRCRRFISVDDYRRQCSRARRDDAVRRRLAVTRGQRVSVFPLADREAKQLLPTGAHAGATSACAKMKESEATRRLLAVIAAMQIMARATWKRSTPRPRTARTFLNASTITATRRVGRQSLPAQVAGRVLYYYTQYGVQQCSIPTRHGAGGYCCISWAEQRVQISVFMGNDNPYACCGP